MSEQSQRLDRLGGLAGSVAHDFNNLLGVILSYSSLVSGELADVAEADPERWEPILRDVDEIRHAAQRGARLARQLLDETDLVMADTNQSSQAHGSATTL